MKRLSLSTLLGGLLLASAGISANATPALTTRGQDKNPLSRMRRATQTERWSNPQATGNGQLRVSPHYSTPMSDSFEYVYAPDGSVWYAITKFETEDIEYEYYTEHLLKGFTITFFDSNFNEVGQVRDKIELYEGETRCVQAIVASQLTKKFFNIDDNVEVMVSFSMNTPDYVTHTRTKAYQIKKLGNEELSESLTVINGYPVDNVNCAKDRWSENFYITFFNEEQPSDSEEFPNYIDYLANSLQVLTTYGKGLEPVMERKISLLNLPGDQMNSPMMLSKNVNGKLTLTYAQYEKSFFVDPTGMGDNEAITPDNHLIIDIYQMNDDYPQKMELLSTTKIETTQNTDNKDVYYTFYGIGNLSWEDDVDFGHYTTDGRAAFVVSVDDYLLSDDDHYNSSYYVYDADGNRINIIAENTYDRIRMSDIPGFEPQVMFVHMGDDMNFEFVDLYSCRTVTEVDQAFRGHTLSVSTDRVLCGESYIYGSALSYGIPIDDDELGAPVCWFDTEGELVRLDIIPTGKGTELAQIYISGDALNPFIFNTDEDMEYMMLVKRKVDGRDSLREELIIATPQKGVIQTFTEEEGKGFIRSVYLITGAAPELLIIFMDDDYNYTTDAYSLPFSKFAGGSGSESDPYLISTGGDLQQMKSAPSAYYKLTADINCGSMSFNPIEEFTGTLDGDGHTISNLRITTPEGGKTGIFKFTSDATVKNIDFYNARLILKGGFEAGLIAATAARTTFDNIHVRRLTATGEDFSGEFGGIAGKSWTLTAFKGCEMAGAEIDLPSCPSAGGIVGDIRTGTTITGCAVTGNMTTNSTLGGIVGSTTTGDEVISQCHVDANLKAENTVGGIVGFLDRSKVKNNYVEGTLEATKPSKWNNAISLGGIAGELEGDWQGKADIPIQQNLIGISSFKYPSIEGLEAQHPRQLATVHRVVGRTSYNTYMEEEPEKVIPEGGVLNNYVVSDLEVIDPEYANNNIEGTTTDKYEIDTDWLEQQLGFSFGTSSETPWNIQSWYAYDPALYYENIVYIPTQEMSVVKGETFDIDIEILSREELTEDDILGAFMCEFDESILEMTGNMTYDGKTMRVEFTAISAGETSVNVSVLSGNAGCNVTVAEGNAVAGIESDGSLLSYANGVVAAKGCAITVYSINGSLLLSGSDKIDVKGLASGVYVATATDSEGKSSTLKFAK